MKNIIIKNKKHTIFKIRDNANYIYNKYKIYEWDNYLLFWDEIKHPTGKNKIIKKYNLK